MKIKTRFSPSPTGYLHVGGLRTALYSFLFAKHNKGEFLLRIEDTDQTRYIEGAEEKLKDILQYMGLKWDGKVVKQSEHLEKYQKAALDLIKSDGAYYCFCTEERLHELRKRQEANKMPSGYDSLCRNILKDEAERRRHKEPFVIRLKMPKTGICEFHDAIRGKIQFAYEREEDIILLKSDGFPTYHLAYVVDDFDMKITHVIRGEEWLPSIPKHVILWQSFGWKMPVHAHVSLIVNPDKSKLSKRQGDVSVEAYLEKGYLKEAILNFILLLGWNPGTEKEMYSIEEMICDFSLEKINKSPAMFNLEKFNWLNGVYIRSMDIDALVDLCIPYLRQAKFIGDTFDKKYIAKIVALEQQRIQKLSDLPLLTDYFFKDIPYNKNLLFWKKQTASDVKEIFYSLKDLLKNIPDSSFTAKKLEEVMMAFVRNNGLSNGEVLWPYRIALCGREKSPGPFEIAEILGKNNVLKRLSFALKLLE